MGCELGNNFKQEADRVCFMMDGNSSPADHWRWRDLPCTGIYVSPDRATKPITDDPISAYGSRG